MHKTTIIIIVTLAFVLSTSYIAAVENPKTRDEQRTWEEKYDKLNIRHSADMKTDTSKELLKIPKNFDEDRDFDIAKTSPTIDFAIVQGLEPWYLPLREENPERYGYPAWGGWGDVTKGPDHCFYFSIGNHMYIGAEGYVIKYDPSSRKQSIVLDMRKLIGWSPDEYGDSKLHGDLDIGPDGDMWILSFFGPYYTEEYRKKDSYRGSYLIRYNIFTGDAENLGIPLDGATWPYHAYDWERGLLYGVSHVSGNVIAYDTKERRMIYGGQPPYNIHWFNRGVLLDRDTGIIYSNDIGDRSLTDDRYSGDQHFVSYKRRNNEFTIMKATVPPHPVTGKKAPMRAHTSVKDASGAYWCMDSIGMMFKFYPAEDRTELVGINWGKNGYYTANMEMSPDGRFLYYIPGLSPQATGTPIVQFDTKTKKKKVISFIFDYYMDKYGYAPVRAYGLELDEKGESLFFYINGGFGTWEQKNPMQIAVRRPAIFHVHIPESERQK